jgi:hypothetical protein
MKPNKSILLAYCAFSLSLQAQISKKTQAQSIQDTPPDTAQTTDKNPLFLLEISALTFLKIIPLVKIFVYDDPLTPFYEIWESWFFQPNFALNIQAMTSIEL